MPPITVTIHKAEKQWVGLPQDQLVSNVQDKNNINTTVMSKLISTHFTFFICISKGNFLWARTIWTGKIKACCKKSLNCLFNLTAYTSISPDKFTFVVQSTSLHLPSDKAAHTSILQAHFQDLVFLQYVFLIFNTRFGSNLKKHRHTGRWTLRGQKKNHLHAKC